MEKLELKHYLDAFKYKTPFVLTDLGIFNLDLEYPDERYRGIGVITDMTTYNNGNEISGILSLNNGSSFDFKIDEEPEIIQAVHPLSDLTKNITENGENLIFYNHFMSKSDLNSINKSIKLKQNILDYISANLYEKMLEYKFDVLGLIEKGLAVDINTLNK